MAFLAAAYALRGLNAGFQEIGVLLAAVGWIFGGQALFQDLRTLPGRQSSSARSSPPPGCGPISD